MNIADFGINNITDKQLNFQYDKFYREMGLKYKKAKKNENDFVEQFKNNNFFECVEKMKDKKDDEFIYKNVNIIRGINSEGKYLHIKIK